MIFKKVSFLERKCAREYYLILSKSTKVIILRDGGRTISLEENICNLGLKGEVLVLFELSFSADTWVPRLGNSAGKEWSLFSIYILVPCPASIGGNVLNGSY